MSKFHWGSWSYAASVVGGLALALVACSSEANDPDYFSEGPTGTGGAGSGGATAGGGAGGAVGVGGADTVGGSGGTSSGEGGAPVGTGGSGASSAGTGGSGTSGSGTGGSATAGSAGASGSGGGSGGDSGSAGTAGVGGSGTQLEWRDANLTNYTSYPDPGSEECVEYNGCEWAGYFAALDDQQTEAWVEAHNIAAVHSKDFDEYKLKTLRLRQGSLEIDVVVYDMCADSDCSGCCTANSSQTGFLIDIESYTAARFGSGDGIVQWACLDC